MTAAPQALVDVGSNSVALVIAQALPVGWQVLHQQKATLRLGGRRDARGALKPDAVEDLGEVLLDFRRRAEAHGAALTTVATASLRGASNRSEVERQLLEKSGVSVEVLSSEDEARLAFRGVWAGDGYSPDPMVAVDVGGGSIEVAWGRSGEVDRTACWAVGVVSLTAQYAQGDPWPDDVLARLDAAIMAQLGPEKSADVGTAVSSGAGSIRRLARLRDASLDRSGLEALVERLARCRQRSERLALEGVDPERADLLLASALVHLRLAERFGWHGYQLSDGGIRRGLLDRAGAPAG